MGRLPLGSAAKTKVGGTRITEAEEDKLKAKYGSVSAFLRSKIDEDLYGEEDTDA